jgi:hypothetical protein
MKDQRKEKIERLERKLLKAHRVSAGELREIVSANGLFDRINARIKAEQAAQQSKDLGKKTIFPVWNWRKAGLVFGALAIFLAGALSLVFYPKQDLSTARSSEPVALPEIRMAQVRVDAPPEAAMSFETENKVRPVTERIALKNKTPKLKTQSARINLSRKLLRPVHNETEIDFYPLAFAENLDEAKEDGKILRVELSRSSLLALGLNPPLGDEAAKFKTDLLVGSDGVARGIRFVK